MKHADTPLQQSAHAPCRGFTLVEVMIALTIMALIMVGLYSTLNATMSTRDMLEREVRAARIGPQILDVIESDLKRVWSFNIDDDMVFQGERKTILGESADTLIFLSSIDSTLVHVVDERTVTADLCETGYRLRASPELPDVLELWRRQSFHVDEDPLEDGSYERLHDRVVSLQFRYYADDDVETDPEENWDASFSHTLPSMVKVTLGIEVGPRMADSQEQRDIGTYWYERLVPLQRDAGLTMRVHPLPPTFLAAAGQGGVGPNSEQGDEDEDEESDREDDDLEDGGGSGAPNDIFDDLFGGGTGGGGGGDSPFDFGDGG